MGVWRELPQIQGENPQVIGIVRPDRYEFGLVTNNELLVYDRTGHEVGSLPLNTRLTMKKTLYNALSIVTSNGSLELAVFTQGRILRYSTHESNRMDVVRRIIAQGKFFKTLTRRGQVGNLRYSQMIWVYMSNIDVLQIVNLLLSV